MPLYLQMGLVWTLCLMHRCVILTMFGSCFCFFKKLLSFLFFILMCFLFLLLFCMIKIKCFFFTFSLKWKAYGTKGGAIGNMSRKMLGTHRVLDGNTMRIWWEHIENNKGLTPLPPTLPERDLLDALCNFIGLAKFLSIPDCGHHLFWPRSMRGAWIVAT